MDLLQAHLTELRVSKSARNTIALRRSSLRAYIDFLHARGASLDTATRRDGIAYLDQWDAAETMRAYRTGIRGLHKWLVLEGERPDNPMTELPSIPRPAPNPRPIPDTVVLDALGRACERDAAMVVLGRFAGLRAAEIAAASRMYLRRQDGEQVVHLLGKGDRWRTVPAHPHVVEVLSPARDHLFVGRHGQPITANTVTRRMSRLLGEGWTAHSLRSGFASELYEQTGDIALVSQLLGHADIETTKRYVLIRDARAAEAVARLRLVAA